MFQAMEQKSLQRCETKVNADACKASYVSKICYLKDFKSFLEEKQSISVYLVCYIVCM